MLDALRGTHFPLPSDARETLAGLEHAARAAPDRADTQYLLGLVLLTQGRAMGFADAFARAEGFFNQAHRLDSAYLAPLARLVDIAAFQGDRARLRRLGAVYLARDSSGGTADYVRWRVALATDDRATLREIRARFDALDLASLRPIVTASQMSGVALGDADSAMKIIANRTPGDARADALFAANILALNQGRPHASDSLLGLRHELDTDQFAFWRATMLPLLFSDGDSATAERSARESARWVARDTMASRWRVERSVEVSQLALWDLRYGRTLDAQALASWIRRHGDPRRPELSRRLADVTDMMVATALGRADAAELRARVDTESLSGCCRAPRQLNLSLASAYELAGNDSAALRVIRRGRWAGPWFLSTYLLREGRLAERLADTAGALRAYEHYLALRSSPEPRMLSQRDSVRDAVNRLRRTR
jgi:hypothetical protein